MENIIISETDRIGDVILSLPVFKTLKKNNKQLKITALVKSYTADIFKGFEFADDIILFDESIKKNKTRFENLLLQIKANNFDTAIALHPDYAVAKLFKKAGIPNRISYGWRWYQYLFTKTIIQHRSKNQQHQAEYNLEIIKKCCEKKIYTDIKLKPQKDALEFIKKLLKTKRIPDKKFIIVHPGSGHSALNLPPEQYLSLIKLISNKFKKLHILITGGPNDTEIIDYFIKNIETSKNIHIMPQNMELSSLIALISLAKIFISNSTGPMHIASALRIPVVAFFSPVFVHSYKRWGPFWGKNLIIVPDVNCPEKWKCKREKCKYFNCFNRIKPDNILPFIKDQLN